MAVRGGGAAARRLRLVRAALGAPGAADAARPAAAAHLRLCRRIGHRPGLLSGLTGIWLVFALFFQDGLGYSPLRSGLAVTPFALGMAASAVIAGRLVARVGR